MYIFITCPPCLYIVGKVHSKSFSQVISSFVTKCFFCFAFLGEPYEFIPLDWLKKWLDDSTATKEIDNSSFLCSHGKLHPDNVGESKRISLQAAQQLYDHYGGGPRLDSKSLQVQLFFEW